MQANEFSMIESRYYETIKNISMLSLRGEIPRKARDKLRNLNHCAIDCFACTRNDILQMFFAVSLYKTLRANRHDELPSTIAEIFFFF